MHNLENPTVKRLAELTKALGHPARISILSILAQKDTCFCGDITELIPLAQSTVSQHLKALKEAGLIKGTVEGVRSCYCLNEDCMDELHQLFGDFSKTIIANRSSDCC